MIDLKSYAALTDQGPYFSLNEDAVHIDIQNNLFLLFDGFGGVNIGDVAVEKLKNIVGEFFTKIGGDPDSTFPFFYSYKYLLEGNALVNAMHQAQEKLLIDNSQKNLTQRAGASMVGAVLADNILTLCSTGNCISYLIRDNLLVSINRPDILTPLNESRHNKSVNTVPLSGFGLYEDLHIEVKEVKVESGDTCLMLTDGAYSLMSENELLYIMQTTDINLSQKITKIFNIVNDRGNLDNQSVIALRF